VILVPQYRHTILKFAIQLKRVIIIFDLHKQKYHLTY
jgi:hypothetical protein